jgi:hypothetical protein
MSHGARSFYVALKWNYNSQTHNNGGIYLSVRKAAREIGSDLKQVVRWYRELQHYGFIVMMKPGYLGVDGKGQAPRWRLTECGTKAKDGTLEPPTRDFLYWNGVRFGSPQKQNPVGEITNTPWVKSPTPPLVKSPTPRASSVGEFTNKGTGQSVGEITHKSSLTTGCGSGGALSERRERPDRTLPLVTVIEGGKAPRCAHCGGKAAHWRTDSIQIASVQTLHHANIANALTVKLLERLIAWWRGQANRDPATHTQPASLTALSSTVPIGGFYQSKDPDDVPF